MICLKGCSFLVEGVMDSLVLTPIVGYWATKSRLDHLLCQLLTIQIPNHCGLNYFAQVKPDIVQRVYDIINVTSITIIS